MILVGTGPLIAAALSGEVNQVRCTELFTSLHLDNEPLLVPSQVVTEVCFVADGWPRGQVSSSGRRHSGAVGLEVADP